MFWNYQTDLWSINYSLYIPGLNLKPKNNNRVPTMSRPGSACGLATSYHSLPPDSFTSQKLTLPFIKIEFQGINVNKDLAINVEDQELSRRSVPGCPRLTASVLRCSLQSHRIIQAWRDVLQSSYHKRAEGFPSGRIWELTSTASGAGEYIYKRIIDAPLLAAMETCRLLTTTVRFNKYFLNVAYILVQSAKNFSMLSSVGGKHTILFNLVSFKYP